MIFLKRMPASNPLLPKQEKNGRGASYLGCFTELFFVLIKLFGQLKRKKGSPNYSHRPNGQNWTELMEWAHWSIEYFFVYSTSARATEGWRSDDVINDQWYIDDVIDW